MPPTMEPRGLDRQTTATPAKARHAAQARRRLAACVPWQVHWCWCESSPRPGFVRRQCRCVRAGKAIAAAALRDAGAVDHGHRHLKPCLRHSAIAASTAFCAASGVSTRMECVAGLGCANAAVAASIAAAGGDGLVHGVSSPESMSGRYRRCCSAIATRTLRRVRNGDSARRSAGSVSLLQSSSVVSRLRTGGALPAQSRALRP